MGVKVTNNAFGTLSAAINTTATTITLDSGQGARFPTLGASDYFFGTLVDTSNNLEIVKVTARSTDSLTVVRGQDGTTATAFAIGDRFELRPVAALFDDIIANTAVDGIASASTSGTAIDIDADNNVTIEEGHFQLDTKTLNTGTVFSNTGDQFMKISNTAVTAVGTLTTADNGNTWLSADGGKDLWLNWRSLNNPASKADLYIGDGNSGSHLFRTDTANSAVLKPQQPAFMAYHQSSDLNYAVGDTLAFPYTLLNRGSHYSTSNSTFTAPVAGDYLFSVNANANYDSGASGIPRAYWRVNGSNIGNAIHLRGSDNQNTGGAADGLEQRSQTVLLTLSANDTVKVVVGVNRWDLFGANSFMGYLLG